MAVTYEKDPPNGFTTKTVEIDGKNRVVLAVLNYRDGRKRFFYKHVPSFFEADANWLLEYGWKEIG